MSGVDGTSSGSAPFVDGEQPPSRWTGPVAAVVTNAVTLALVLRGDLDLRDLLVCYGIETVFLGCVVLAGKPFDRLKVMGAMLVLTLLFSARALFGNSWDAASLLAIGITVAVSVVGLVVSARRRDEPPRVGAVGWRLFVVFFGNAVALGYAEGIEPLRAVGWEPTTYSSAPGQPFGLFFIHVADSLGLPALSAAAVMLMTVKIFNEAGYETYDLLRDRAVAHRRARLP